MALRIGKTQLKYGLFLAPMAGVTNAVFRRICREMGAEFTVTEMISAKAMHFEDRKTATLGRIFEGDVPCAVQIFGHEPDLMAEAARRLALRDYPEGELSLPPAAIDINMGCPVHKIVSSGDGSALMRSPELAGQIVSAVVEAVAPLGVPVTVKIRSGWSGAEKNAVTLARIAEREGAAAVTVHGRTRDQMYSGASDASVIGEVKAALSIPVIGNGDVVDAQSALALLRETRCDGLMIGRGAFGNPWVFSEIRAALEGEDYTPPTQSERIDAAVRHLRQMAEVRGEEPGVREARGQIAHYIKGMRGGAAVRDRINHALSVAEATAALEGLKTDE